MAVCKKRRAASLRPVCPSSALRATFSREGSRQKAYYSFAAFFSCSALSVFSQEKAVAVCFLPVPST